MNKASRISYQFPVFLVLLSCASWASSARILGVFLYPSRTHHLLGTSLLTELANRGHDVLMISTFKIDPILYKDIQHIHVDMTHLENQQSKCLMNLNVSMWQHVKFSNTDMKYMVASFLEDVKLQELLNNNEKYDVAITVLFSEALLGISHRVNATTIAFHPTGSENAINYLTGNPHPYAYVPNPFYGYSDSMTFIERFLNSYSNIFYTFTKHFFNIPMQKSLLKFYFPDAPPLEELLDNVDLHLVNTNQALELPKPYMSNMIRIGGFHVQKPERLTVDLLKYLDESQNGLILFTLGSHKRFGDYKVKTIEMLFSTFAKVAQNILVQYEGPQLNKIPKNVRLMAWVPQRAVLSHPNTKLFITHGGHTSLAEAVHFGIPIIALSVDDADNTAAGRLVDVLVARGCGLHFHLDDNLRDETLVAGVREIVANSAYKIAIMSESEYYRATEVNPLERAVYWVEHVAKYKGCKRLKSSPAATLPFYKYFLLDIVLATFILFTLSAIATFSLSRVVYRVLIRRKRMRDLKHKSV